MERSTPVVSVLTAVYNDPEHLPRAVESVRAQTFTNWELLIVDDASTDDTLRLAHELAEGDSRIRVIAAEHGGPAHARNVGIREATGEWVAILDSDDFCAPERLEHQLEFAAAHPSAGCIGAFAHHQLESGVSLGIRHGGPQTLEAFARQKAAGVLSFPHSSVLARRDLLLQVGGYPEDYTLSEDTALYNLRLAPVTDILVVPEPLVTTVVHSGSITHRISHPLVSYDEIIRLNVSRRNRGESELSPAEATALLLAGDSRWARFRRWRFARSGALRTRGQAQLGSGSPRGLLPLVGAWFLDPGQTFHVYARRWRTYRFGRPHSAPSTTEPTPRSSDGSQRPPPHESHLST